MRVWRVGAGLESRLGSWQAGELGLTCGGKGVAGWQEGRLAADKRGT